MSTIALIRHGETGMAGRFCGHSDPDLNAVGHHEAIHVAEEVSRLSIARIYSSDLRRASQTAKAIAQQTGIAADYLTGLREVHFGQWEGLTWQEIEARFPDEADQWLREFPLRSAPGGETYTAFTARVETAIAALLCEAAGMTIAVVTHRGVMRHALTKFFGFAETEAWERTAAYGATVIAAIPPSVCEVLP
jgi:alpha-ribazole phosphatase/probable phosphoglycerate mutase